MKLSVRALTALGIGLLAGAALAALALWEVGGLVALRGEVEPPAVSAPPPATSPPSAVTDAPDAPGSP